MDHSRRALLIGLMLTVVLFAPVVNVSARTTDVASESSDILPFDLPEFMKYISINGLMFDPLVDSPDVPTSLTYDSVADDEPSYYIIQFNKPVTHDMKASLESTGIKILYYVSYNGFVVRADSHSLDQAKQLAFVRWAGMFEPAYKISPRLSQEYDAVLAEQLENAKAFGQPASSQASSFVASGFEAQNKVAGSAGSYASRDAMPMAQSSTYTKTFSPTDSASSLKSTDYVDPRTPNSIDSSTASSSRISLEVVAFEKTRVLEIADAVKNLGGTDIIYSYGKSGLVRAEFDRSMIPALAREFGVMWIDRYIQPYVMNDVARWVIQSADGITYATPIHDHGVWGTGQTVTICDTGIDYQHDAFEDPLHATPGPEHRKVTDYYIPPGAGGDDTDNGINHGTHTSGTVGGDDGTWHVYDGDPLGSSGTAGPHDGQAFDAMIQVQDLSTDGYFVYPPSDITVIYSEAANRGSYIHSNSWGGGGGTYIQEAADTDEYIWNNQDMVVLYAAGNPGPYPGGVNSFSVAKNVISVGATVNGAMMQDVADFSGRGPAEDGRLKPDVMAPGVDIWSAHGGDPGGVYDDYFQLSGTSMATPTAAGSATLVRQYFMNGYYPTGDVQPLNGFTPSAALIKAVLINSGSEMTGNGAYINGETRYPNYNQGWGRLLLDDALYFQGDTRGLVIKDDRTGLNTGGSAGYQLAVGDTSMPVEITLVWSDYPGLAMTSPNLVNDLDLVVTAPDGTVYIGNRYYGYDPGMSQPNPTNGTDHLNNVEGVLVYGPQTGIWTIQVSGFNVPYGPQPYAIVMTGGIATNLGSVQLDRNSYRSDARVNITVVDTGLNVNPNGTDFTWVNISSDTELVPEVVMLNETGSATAVFRGSIQLDNNPIPISDGLLQVMNGDTIVVSYYDFDNGLGESGHVYDYALVDDDPPFIYNVSAINVRFNRATIIWNTDESSDSVVYWGNSTPPINVKSDSRRTLSHSIGLSGLSELTTYYFAVQSTDEPGNTALDDNSSNYYRFTTSARPPMPPSSEDWPMYHNNPPRLGVSPSTFFPPLSQQWISGPNYYMRWTAPVYAEGVLVSTTMDGYVRARDPYSGAVLWARLLGGTDYYTSAPAIENGVVYVTMARYTGGPNSGSIYALDLLSGDTIWSVGPETGVDFNARNMMVTSDGLLFSSDWAGEIFALDLANGSFDWRFNTGHQPIAGATVGAGTVIMTTLDGPVIALDEFTGSFLWSAALDSIAIGPPLYAQDNIYLGSVSGTMYCLDAMTGSTVWSKSGFSQFDFGTPAYDGTAIYFGTFGGAYVALDATDGSLLWQTGIGSPVGSAVAYANGYVYATAWDGQLRVLDAFDGSIVASYMLNSVTSSSPAVADGWVWVEDQVGSIYGFQGQVPIGLRVSPAMQHKDAIPSSAVDYTVTVRNIGTSGPDTFDTLIHLGTLGWTVELFHADGVTPLIDTDGDGKVDTGSVATGDSTEVILRVNVPAGALAEDEDTSIVSFFSSNDPMIWKNSTVVTTVPPPGVDIGPRSYFPLNPGDIATATLEVRNTGAFPDTMDLTAISDHGWTVSLFEADGVTPLTDTDGDNISDTGVIVGLGSVPIVVQVEVPLGASMGAVDRTNITAISSADIGQRDSTLLVIELASPPNEGWPTFQNDKARRGIAPTPFEPPLELQWSTGPTFETYYCSPAVDNGMLFYTTTDGFIRACDQYTGTTIWQKRLGGMYYYTGTPTIENGVIYIAFSGDMGGTYYALDEMTGDVIWSVGSSGNTSIAARTEKAVSDGMAFGSAWSGEIFALDADDGSLVWSYDTYQSPEGGIAVGGGLVYMPTWEGTMFALDEFTGALVWSASLGGLGISAPTYAQGNIYVGTESGTMLAFDAQSGSLVWQTSGLGSIWCITPSYSGTAIFIGTGSGTYYALDAGDGSILWQTSGSNHVESSAAYANGYVYGAAWDGYLRVFDADTGVVVQQYMLNYTSSSSVAISDGWVYVMDLDGNLYAFIGQMPVALILRPVTQSRDAAPSMVMDYVINVTNEGTLPADTFDVTVTQGALGWSVDLLESDGVTPLNDSDGDGTPDTGLVSSDATVMVIVRVQVPAGALAGDVETDIIDFTSSNDVTVSKSAHITTTVPYPGVEIGPRVHFSLRPGDIAKADMLVKNAGGFPDTIDLTAVSSHGWTTSLFEGDGVTSLTDNDGDGVPDTGLLAGLEDIPIVVQVEIPFGATMGTVDITIVTGTSSTDITKSDSASVVIELETPPNDEWPTFHNDNARRGVSESVFSPPLVQQWRAGPTFESPFTGPALADDILFMTTGDGRITARDPQTGSQLWSRQLGGMYYYSPTPTIANGIVYVPFSDGTGDYMFALDERTGTTIWSSSAYSYNAEMSTIVAEGMVFCGGWDNQIIALDADDGSLVWVNNIGMQPGGGLAIGAGMLLTIAYQGAIFALDEFSGALIWSQTLDSQVLSAPLYAQGNVYIGTLAGTLYAFDVTSGNEIWQSPGLGAFWGVVTPAYHSGVLYFGTDASAYFAADASDGTILWQTPVGWWVESAVAYANGYVYGTDYNGYLDVLDASTGTMIQQIYLGGYASCSPAVSDGWVWVHDSNGWTYGFVGQMPVGLTVKPATQGAETVPSSVIDYVLDVTNIGTLPVDTFDADVTLGMHGWNVELLHFDGVTPLNDTDADGTIDTGAMASNTTRGVIVRVTVPSNASGGDIDSVKVEFTSSNDENISKSAQMMTTVPLPGADIGPDAYFAQNPGDIVLVPLDVRNTGGLPDTLDITATSGHGWTISLYQHDGATPLDDTDGDGVPDVGLLQGLESTRIYVEVQVPTGAQMGTVDITGVTATSSLDPLESDSAAITIELSPEPDDEWPTFMNNNVRQGRSPSLFLPPIVLQWQAGPFYESYGVSPILDNGILFVTTQDGYLRALDPFTGLLLWEQSLGSPGYWTGTPVAADGAVYSVFATDNESHLYAVDEFTGEVIWSVGAETGLMFSEDDELAFADGMIFGATWNGYLYAVDAATGDEIWRHFMGSNASSCSPTVAAGKVYAGLESGEFLAVDEFTGAVVWTQELVTGTSAAPMYARGNVYISTWGGYMYALDAFDGDVVWMTSGLGSMWYVTPAYDGSNIYFGAGYVILALDAVDGSIVWQTYTGTMVATASMAYANGYLYATCWEGSLYTIDASDGYVFAADGLWWYSTSSPIVSDGWVWVLNSQGQVFGFMGLLPIGVQVVPSYQEIVTMPSTANDYSLFVTNIGTLPTDTFDVTYAEGVHGWDVELLKSDHVTPLADTDGDGNPDTGSMMSDTMMEIVVRVTVPAAVNASDEEITVITLTSSNDPAVSRDARLATIIPPSGAAIGPRAYFSVSPGQIVQALMNVTNIGPLADTFDMTGTSDLGWTVTLLEGDGVTPLADSDGDGIPDTSTLVSGGSKAIVIQVEVPLNAMAGVLDRTEVVATSSADPTREAMSYLMLEVPTAGTREWPTSHHDPSRTGVNPMPFELPLTLRWSYSVGGDIAMYGAIIHDETVFCSDATGTVYALDLMTGGLLWATNIANYYAGTPTAAYGNIYVVAEASNGYMWLVCLDEDTGTIEWQTYGIAGGGAIYTCPAVSAGIVYWSSYVQGWVCANDAMTGEQLWLYYAPSWASDGPTYWAGTVFLGDESGNVIALDASAGDVIWMVNVGITVYSVPAVTEGLLLVSDIGGFVHAFDPMTGSELWTSPDLGDGVYASAEILAEGLVFVGAYNYSGDGAMYALDANTGAIVWYYPISYGGITTSSAYNNGTIFAAADDGVLYAWKAATGEVLQNISLPLVGYLTAVSVGDGYLLVGSGSWLSCYGFEGAGVLSQVEVAPASGDVEVGHGAVFTAQAYDAYYNEIEGVTYSWTSTNGLGTVVPLTLEGDIVVYIAGPDAGVDSLLCNCSGVFGNAQVNVVPGPVFSIEVTPSGVDVLAGESQQFTAVAKDRYGNEVPGTTFIWGVTGGIGTVDGEGLLTASTAVAMGTVTATFAGVTGFAEVEIIPGPLLSIVAAPSSITSAVGTTIVIHAQGYDMYGNEIQGLTFIWSTDIGTVTSSSMNGDYAAFETGHVTGWGNISVSSGTRMRYVQVQVLPGPLAVLTVSPSSASVQAGASQAFAVTGTDAYGNVISTLSVLWSVSPAIGTITQAGALTAETHVASGTVTASSGSVSATANVDIVPGALETIVVSPTPTVVIVGTTTALTAIGLDQYGNEIEGLTFAWSSSAGAVAPLNLNWSWVTYAAPTTVAAVTVNATVGAVHGTAYVAVLAGQLATLNISPTDANVSAGDTVAFIVTGRDLYGNPVSGGTVSWSTTGGSIVANGTLTAPTTVGSVVVTASAGTRTAKATVTVVPGPLDHMVVSETSLKLKTGDAASLAVECFDQYGNEIYGLEMTWSTTLGSIEPSEDGYTAAFATGEHAGKGTVTVSAGNKSATVEVSVGASSIPLGRQLAQPISLVFLAIAIALALLLLFIFLNGRKLGGQGSPPETSKGQ